MNIPRITTTPGSTLMIEVGTSGLLRVPAETKLAMVRTKFRRTFPKSVSLLIFSNEAHHQVLIKAVIN